MPLPAKVQQKAFDQVESYFIGSLEASKRESSKLKLRALAKTLGPVIEAYPSWHPLVSRGARMPHTLPGRESGYEGLNHTRYFLSGFITCPYGDNAQKVIDSVEALGRKSGGHIQACKLDFQLYHQDATPVLVTCQWRNNLAEDGTIPLPLATALLLEQELPAWEWTQKSAEWWMDRRTDFMGRPHSQSYSAFLNRETVKAIRKVWNALIDTGIYGPRWGAD